MAFHLIGIEVKAYDYTSGPGAVRRHYSLKPGSVWRVFRRTDLDGFRSLTPPGVR